MLVLRVTFSAEKARLSSLKFNARFYDHDPPPNEARKDPELVLHSPGVALGDEVSKVSQQGGSSGSVKPKLAGIQAGQFDFHGEHTIEQQTSQKVSGKLKPASKPNVCEFTFQEDRHAKQGIFNVCDMVLVVIKEKGPFVLRLFYTASEVTTKLGVISFSEPIKNQKNIIIGREIRIGAEYLPAALDFQQLDFKAAMPDRTTNGCLEIDLKKLTTPTPVS